MVAADIIVTEWLFSHVLLSFIDELGHPGGARALLVNLVV